MEISVFRRYIWGTEVMAVKLTKGNKRFRLFLLKPARRQARLLRVREKKMGVTKMSENLSLKRI